MAQECPAPLLHRLPRTPRLPSQQSRIGQTSAAAAHPRPGAGPAALTVPVLAKQKCLHLAIQPKEQEPTHLRPSAAPGSPRSAAPPPVCWPPQLRSACTARPLAPRSATQRGARQGPVRGEPGGEWAAQCNGQAQKTTGACSAQPINEASQQQRLLERALRALNPLKLPQPAHTWYTSSQLRRRRLRYSSRCLQKSSGNGSKRA